MLILIVSFVKLKSAGVRAKASPYRDKADHLHICQVNLGNEETQIVCGAPNVEQGQRVVVATIGAIMPSGLVIKPSKLRKVDSNGMICSARELGLPNAPQVRGILVLDKEKYNIGESFF